MTTDLRHLLAIYVHAHQTGNSVPPHIDAEARAALGEADGPAVPEGKKPTRDELWELWLRLNNELPDRPAAVAEFWEHAQIDARARAAELLERLSTTQKELERERLRLAVCGVVAMADTPETAAKARDCLPEYWSASADDIARQIDKLMRLIEEHYADEPAAPAPPADGEVAELVRTLTGIAHWRRRGRPGEGDPSPFDIRQADRLDRAAELLERQAPVPVAVSDALIKAECALADIAEGEPMTDEGDPLKWAERRCADTLAIIRPTMMQHKIRTSEWPPLPLPEVRE